jgi:hypothetical protein
MAAMTSRENQEYIKCIPNKTNSNEIEKSGKKVAK